MQLQPVQDDKEYIYNGIATSEQVTNFMVITMIAIVLYSTSTVFIVLYL
jgi:hypothetical protein